MPAAKQTGLAEILGVDPAHFHGDFSVKPPEDPEKARRSHDRDMAIIVTTRWTIIASIVASVVLPGIFLWHGKPEQAEKVVATLIGLIGGLGLGRQTVAKD